MATTTAIKTTGGRIGPLGNGRAGPPSGRGRRRPVQVLAGAFLVVVLALAFMWIQLRADESVSVLVVARPVPAGQVITAADVAVASVVADPKVRVVPESQAATVVGRAAAVPLMVGALLSPDQVGPVAWPAAGQAVVAVPVKPGHVPTGVTAGARVRVLTIAADGPVSTDGPPAGVLATVVHVDSTVDASGTAVVSLLVATADLGVAAAGGEVTLVLLGPGG